MPSSHHSLVLALMNEISTSDQLLRAHISKALPKGMELSHFLVLNHLSLNSAEKSPADLAKTFNLTRGAMTNTLHKLEWYGWIYIRPDWDDARRKLVSITPTGRSNCEGALRAIDPIIKDVSQIVSMDKIKTVLPVLRDIRTHLSEK